jgi:hypothetical protein
MPVIRPQGGGEPVALVKKRLVEALVRELSGERGRRGPVIFEILTDPPGSIDVIVVWEAWRPLSPADRSAVIREAYDQFAKILEEGIHPIDPEKPIEPLVTPRSGMVIGATWEDVEKLNLLPYSVEPRMSPSEDVDQEALRLLMIDAGAIETPQGLQLRFPNHEMASQVRAQLTGEMPEANWTVVEGAGSADDWSEP